ncbi:MAG: O-antigen ligase family protein [Patescibacteria group bacterium]
MKVAKDTYLLNLKRLEKFLFYSLIFLLPTQLAYHFWPEYAFIFGIRVDYLAPAIYLTDLIIIFLLVISRTKVKRFYILAICIFAYLNISNSISPWVSFWKWIKIAELILFAKYIHDNIKLLKTQTFANVFSLSLILISLIGISQFLTGGTLGFTPLGERTFNVSTPGTALQEFFGKSYLRAYSIFSHPNSFAGYLFISVVLFFSQLKKTKFFLPTLLISSVAFLLTFSLSAFMGTGIGIPLAFTKFNLSSPEISERLELINISKDVITHNFFIGSGLGTFVLTNKLMQPVHNIFLLAFAETGILGVVALCFLVYKLIKKNIYIFVFILITGLLDHYWLTIQQNMLLLTLVFSPLF